MRKSNNIVLDIFASQHKYKILGVAIALKQCGAHHLSCTILV